MTEADGTPPTIIVGRARIYWAPDRDAAAAAELGAVPYDVRPVPRGYAAEPAT